MANDSAKAAREAGKQGAKRALKSSAASYEPVADQYYFPRSKKWAPASKGLRPQDLYAGAKERNAADRKEFKARHGY